MSREALQVLLPEGDVGIACGPTARGLPDLRQHGQIRSLHGLRRFDPIHAPAGDRVENNPEILPAGDTSGIEAVFGQRVAEVASQALPRSAGRELIVEAGKPERARTSGLCAQIIDERLHLLTAGPDAEHTAPERAYRLLARFHGVPCNLHVVQA